MNSDATIAPPGFPGTTARLLNEPGVDAVSPEMDAFGNPGFRILLVEDNPGDADLIGELLEEAGVPASNLEFVARLSDAVSYLHDTLPDAVILDLGLPDSHGLETLRAIRGEAPDAPVIVMTGLDDEKTGLAAVSEGAQDYLVKGNIAGRLLKRILDYAIERQRTKQRLHDSERFLRASIDALSAHIAILDVNGNILFVNAAWDDFAYANGIDPAEVSEGCNYLDVCARTQDPDDKRFAQGIRAVLAGEQPYFEMEYSCHSPEVKRWFIGRASSFPNGPTRCVAVAHENITERKKSEERLRDLGAALDQTAEGVVLTDREGVIFYVNAAMLEMTGYSWDELIGVKPKIFSSGLHDEAFYAALWSTLQAGRIWRGSFINRRKDGTLYQEDATISPVFGQNGDTISYVAVKRDMTERLEQERKQRQAQKMEAIGTLAGGIAHDFNNILSAILGYSEIVYVDLPEGSGARSDLSHVIKGAHRAKDLVHQILTFSRQAEEEPHLFKPHTVIKEALKLLKPSFPSTIEIIEDIDTNTGQIMADPTRLHQVLMNLCTNAYQAMREGGGELRVGLENVLVGAAMARQMHAPREGTYMLLSVADTGEGIAPENLERIFDPFFTTKTDFGGTGLGLATVHGIVTAAGGFIQVKSEKGKGATFEVYLPCYCDSSEERSQERECVSGGHEHILVVDDEMELVTMWERVLSRLGYRVTTADNALTALERFTQSPGDYDLVITDYTMPKMTGFELIKKLRVLRPSLPVILSTGSSDQFSEEQLELVHVDCILLKPCSCEEMAKTIRETLSGKKW